MRRLCVIAVVETKSMLLRQQMRDGRLACPTSTADPANVLQLLGREVNLTRGVLHPVYSPPVFHSGDSSSHSQSKYSRCGAAFSGNESLRIPQKIGHFLPKDGPHKKKLVNPLCKPIHTAW